ncbi:hypothetical protein CHUAL_012673 [Chamberlinius hualienensis]
MLKKMAKLLIIVSMVLTMFALTNCEEEEHHHIRQPSHDPLLHRVESRSEDDRRQAMPVDARGYPLHPGQSKNVEIGGPKLGGAYGAQSGNGAYLYALG